MSEKKLEPDIAKFKDAHARCCYVWLGKNAVPELIAELERLRADPPTGWREGIEAAAKVCEAHIGKYEPYSEERSLLRRLARHIRALVPPGDKEKESQDD